MRLSPGLHPVINVHARYAKLCGYSVILCGGTQGLTEMRANMDLICIFSS